MDFIRLHKWLFIGGCLLFLVIGSVLYTIFSNVDVSNNYNTVQNIESVKIHVDIKGEVLNPGVYEVDQELIIEDVVLLAGGLTTDADVGSINMASKVVDGMYIFIPGIKNESSSDKVSINSGSLTELMTLPGIGESRALAIIEYREVNGYFSNLEGLMNVSGIGQATFNNIKDFISL